MATWPKDKLLRHGPDLPIAERVRRYQHNIRAIRPAGCAVPTSAAIDTIEMWFQDSVERHLRLGAAVRNLGALPPEPEAE